MTKLVTTALLLTLLVSTEGPASACDCGKPIDREAVGLETFRRADVVAVGRMVRPVKLPKRDLRSVGHAEYRIEKSWKGLAVGTVIPVDFTLSPDPGADCTHGKPREVENFYFADRRPGYYVLTMACIAAPTDKLLKSIEEERRQKEEAAAGDDMAALAELGRFFRYYGMRGEAVETFARMHAKDRSDVWAIRALGEAHLAAGQLQDALALLGQAHATVGNDGKSVVLDAYVNREWRKMRQRKMDPDQPRSAVSLVGKDFEGTEFFDLRLANMDLSGGKFEKTTWERMTLENISITNTQILGNHFSGTTFKDVTIRDALIRHSNFIDTDFKRFKIEDSTLTGVSFGPDRYDRTPLDIKMSNVLLRGVEFNRKHSSADFRTVRFEDVRFDHVDLRGADFRGVDLRRVSFVGSWLNGIKGDCATKFPDNLDVSTVEMDVTYASCTE